MTPTIRTSATMPQQTILGFVTLALCLLAVDGAAQDETASLEELLRGGALQRGDDIYVTGASGRVVRGNVVDASATALSLTDGRETWTLGRSEISRIERHDSVAPGICLGFGVAFAAWMYGWCRIEARDADTCYLAFRYLAPTLAVGGLVGWSVDRRMRKTLYEAPGSARLTMAPLLSGDRAGAMASVTW